jgi:NADH:ubiquinone oxidoreductase subunit 4 (subunit M)
MILAAMASAGIPGMVGFIAEFLVFRGSFPIFPIQTLLCLVASGLTAVYFLLMINRVFFGRLTPELSKKSGLKPRLLRRKVFGGGHKFSLQKQLLTSDFVNAHLTGGQTS